MKIANLPLDELVTCPSLAQCQLGLALNLATLQKKSGYRWRMDIYCFDLALIVIIFLSTLGLQQWAVWRTCTQFTAARMWIPGENISTSLWMFAGGPQPRVTQLCSDVCSPGLITLRLSITCRDIFQLVSLKPGKEVDHKLQSLITKTPLNSVKMILRSV